MPYELSCLIPPPPRFQTFAEIIEELQPNDAVLCAFLRKRCMFVNRDDAREAIQTLIPGFGDKVTIQQLMRAD